MNTTDLDININSYCNTIWILLSLFLIGNRFSIAWHFDFGFWPFPGMKLSNVTVNQTKQSMITKRNFIFSFTCTSLPFTKAEASTQPFKIGFVPFWKACFLLIISCCFLFHNLIIYMVATTINFVFFHFFFIFLCFFKIYYGFSYLSNFVFYNFRILWIINFLTFSFITLFAFSYLSK